LGDEGTSLMNATVQRKKRAVVIATAHLLFWFFVLSVLDKKGVAARQSFIVAGIALLIAAWIQYRAVRAYRRSIKAEDSTKGDIELPPMRGSSHR
jgi:hypothetical protein